MSWVQVPSLAPPFLPEPDLPAPSCWGGRHASCRWMAARWCAWAERPLCVRLAVAVGPGSAGALLVVNHMNDAGPHLTALGVVAIDHVVELLGGHPGGVGPMLCDQLARDAFDFSVPDDHLPALLGDRYRRSSIHRTSSNDTAR